MSRTATDPNQQKREIDAQLSDMRTERVELVRERDEARDKYAATENLSQHSREYKAAQAAREKLEAHDDVIAALTSRQVGLVELFGGKQHGRPGRHGNGPTGEGSGDGWAFAARELGTGEGGRTRIDVPASDLLRPAVPMAGTTFTPENPLAPGLFVPGITEAPANRQFLYPWLARGEDLEQGDLSVADWTQTSREVEGTVLRAPGAITEKAKVNLGAVLAQPSVKQVAALAQAPNQLLESINTFSEFMRAELVLQLDKSVDTDVVLGAVTAAKVPNGKDGADLIAQTRNAKAVMVTAGANPTLAVMTPTQKAELDLMKTELGYVWGLRPGGANELWGMTVIESPTVTNPTLIDPVLLGRLFLEMGTILLDPFTSAHTNETRIRVEFNCLYHVRYAAGAYEIKEEEKGK